MVRRVRWQTTYRSLFRWLRGNLLLLSELLPSVFGLGSFTERHFALMTFGIPTQFLPVDVDGNIQLEHHNLWLEQRRQSESMRERNQDQDPALQDTKSPPVIPGSLDVLFGREKTSQVHPGNARYHMIITSNIELYDSTASKQGKTELALRLIREIKESGGRFLKLEKEGWVVVDDDAARVKVANAFRSRRKHAKPRTKNLLKEFEPTKRQKLEKEAEAEAEASKRFTPTPSVVISDDNNDMMNVTKRAKSSAEVGHGGRGLEQSKIGTTYRDYFDA